MNIKYITLFSLAIIANMGAAESKGLQDAKKSKRLQDAQIRLEVAWRNLDSCMQRKNNQSELMKKIWPVNCEKQQQEFRKAATEYGLAEFNEIVGSLLR